MGEGAKNKNKIWKNFLLFEENIRLGVTKVGVRCQLSGKYRGAAHQISNLSVEKGQSLLDPVVFHHFTKFLSIIFYFINNLYKSKQ